MPFQAVPDTAHIKMKFTHVVASQCDVYCRNVTAPGWSSGRLQDLADAVVAWWNADGVDVFSDAGELTEVETIDIGDEFGLRATASAGANGTVTGDFLPTNNAALVTFLGDAGSPPRKGRIYWPSLSESQVTGNLITTAAETALQTAMESLVDAINGASTGNAFVIVSRYSGFTLVDYPDGTTRKVPTKRDPAVTNTISGVNVRRTIASQRNRRGSVVVP